MRKRMLYHAGRNPPRVGLHASRLPDRLSAGRIYITHAEPYTVGWYLKACGVLCLSRRATLTWQNTYVCCFTEIGKYKQMSPAEVPKMRFRLTDYRIPT